MMRTCIIGGAGFIGQHLMNALLSQGKKIRIVGRRSQELVALPDNVEYFQGDVRNRGFLLRALSEVDEIVDLAYSSVPKTSYENPLLDISDNLPGTVGLFDVVSGLSIKKIVYVSSGGTVYGEPQALPIAETHPTNPISPYGITKLALEKYAQMYHRLKGLPVVCVRPSNPYGEGQMPFIGQGFVATAIASMLAGRELTIYGDTGTTRDYIYVKDLALGLAAALDYGVPGEVYNLGSGVGRTNLDIIKELMPFAQEQGLKPLIGHVAPRSFDVSSNVLESGKLRSCSDWEPKVSLSEGLRLTWDWHVAQYEGSGAP